MTYLSYFHLVVNCFPENIFIWMIKKRSDLNELVSDLTMGFFSLKNNKERKGKKKGRRREEKKEERKEGKKKGEGKKRDITFDTEKFSSI